MNKSKKYAIKSAILMLIFLGSCYDLTAQVSIGIYSGIAANSLNGDPVAFNVYKPHVGWNAGAILDLNITDDILLSLQPGIIYSFGRVQTADTVEFPLNTRLIYRDSVDISMGSVNLPVLVKVITDNQRFQFSSGIEVGYLINAKWDNGSEKIDIKAKLYDFNVAVIFGIGYRIPIKETCLTIDIRYSQGIINQSNSGNELSGLKRIKTSSLRLLIAWTIPMKKADGNNE